MRDISCFRRTSVVCGNLPGLACLFGVIVFLYGVPAFSQTGMELQTVVKISADDHAAVVETADREKRLVKEDDMLLGYRVTEISESRMVLEGAGANGPEKVILSFTDGEQSAMRVTRTAPTAQGSGLMVSGEQGER